MFFIKFLDPKYSIYLPIIEHAKVQFFHVYKRPFMNFYM